MRVVAAARRHRAQRAVARVVRLQVAARRRQPRQPRAAQRTLHRAAPQAPLALRVCQQRGICNADITMLQNRFSGKPDANAALILHNKLSKNISCASVVEPSQSTRSPGTAVITTRSRAGAGTGGLGALARLDAVSRSSVAAGCRAPAAGG